MHQSLNAIMYEADNISAFTHSMHTVVMNVATTAMYALELLSVLIIVYTTIVSFYRLFKHNSSARVYLLHGQSLGLSFKLGAEILRTITALSIEEIWEVFLLIIIKACMVLLIEWELNSIENPHTEDNPFRRIHPKNLRVRRPSARNTTCKESAQLEQIQEQLNMLQKQLKNNQSAQNSSDPHN